MEIQLRFDNSDDDELAIESVLSFERSTRGGTLLSDRVASLEIPAASSCCYLFVVFTGLDARCQSQPRKEVSVPDASTALLSEFGLTSAPWPDRATTADFEVLKVTACSL